MNCAFEKDGDDVIAKLPQRLVAWYGLEGLREPDYKIIGEPDKLRVRVQLDPLIRRTLGQ
ncbi:hypothetical protein D3C83_251340 [compost metagenome]